MICTFFGHRDSPECIRNILKEKIKELITTYNVDRFYVGNQGNFDRMVYSALSEIKTQYPHIEYTVVLAYFPKNNETLENNTALPEGIEMILKRFAISYRNRWMINQAQFVICYVHYSTGGAAQFCKLARKKGIPVFNLAE